MKTPSSFAAVAPRAYSPMTGESMLLVDLISQELYSATRTVQLVGRGKSTALSHLAAEFRANEDIRFLDGERSTDNQEWNLTVFVYSAKCTPDVKLRLVHWEQDELIEYLMAIAPTRCKSVMARIMSSGDLWLGNGSPQVLSIVLDSMIQSDEIQSVEEAIRTYFDDLDLTDSHRNKIINLCLRRIFDTKSVRAGLTKMLPQILSRATVKFLCNQTVRYVLAEREIVESLTIRNTPTVMNLTWPRMLVELIASKIEDNAAAISFLDKIANRTKSTPSANAAGLLVQNNVNWRPTRKSRLDFGYAHLAGANWSDVVAQKSSLTSVNLSHADLRRANFTKSTLTSANFHGANMTGAVIKGVYAWRSDFSEAILQAANADCASFKNANFKNANAEFGSFLDSDFAGANLQNADFSKANMCGAIFIEADTQEAIFSNAILKNASFYRLDLRSVVFDGADLTNATMAMCDMEGMRLSNVLIEKAWLSGAILTGTHFRDVSLRKTRLDNAKLADVNWEGCDLRGAQFVDTHFHMGSTRSGLVNSPYPSHGTRTGFYTDEFDEQYFKRPEEIRKANLCGCDLRGAGVIRSDFYLVDLRGAIYDDKQKGHFLRCGAILTD